MEIKHLAETMKVCEVDDVIWLACLSPVKVDTRVGLEIQLCQRRRYLEEAKAHDDWLLYRNTEELIKELESLRGDFPTLEELQDKMRILRERIKSTSCGGGSYNGLKGMYEELDMVEYQISLESELEELVEERRGLLLVADDSGDTSSINEARLREVKNRIKQLAYPGRPSADNSMNGV